jgi:hypothetical protein
MGENPTEIIHPFMAFWLGVNARGANALAFLCHEKQKNPRLSSDFLLWDRLLSLHAPRLRPDRLRTGARAGIARKLRPRPMLCWPNSLWSRRSRCWAAWTACSRKPFRPSICRASRCPMLPWAFAPGDRLPPMPAAWRWPPPGIRSSPTNWVRAWAGMPAPAVSIFCSARASTSHAHRWPAATSNISPKTPS